MINAERNWLIESVYEGSVRRNEDVIRAASKAAAIELFGQSPNETIVHVRPTLRDAMQGGY